MIVTDRSHPVLEARIDWLTATVKPGLAQAVMAAAGTRWLEEDAGNGGRVKPWRWQGYLGDAGDGVSYGERQDGSIIRLSGEMAGKHAATAIGFAHNVSRIDVQVTTQDPNEQANWAERVLGVVRQDKRVVSGMTKTTILRSTPSGTTTYIGSRSSDRYFRVYDKHSESQGAYPPGSWRWEVEYKNDRAWSVAMRAKSDECRPNRCREIVEQAFYDYGVILPSGPLPMTWRDRGIRSETTNERRLAWLRSSIAPCVGKLREAYATSDILDALGLVDVAEQLGAK